MPIGKESIMRAAQASGGTVETKEVVEVTKVAQATKESTKTKVPVKKAMPKKVAAKVPVKKTVIASASDDILEQKFEAVSHIYSELPVYLL